MVHADADPKGPLLFGDESVDYVTYTDYATMAARNSRNFDLAGMFAAERDELRDQLAALLAERDALRLQLIVKEGERDNASRLATELKARAESDESKLQAAEARAVAAEARSDALMDCIDMATHWLDRYEAGIDDAVTTVQKVHEALWPDGDPGRDDAALAPQDRTGEG